MYHFSILIYIYILPSYYFDFFIVIMFNFFYLIVYIQFHNKKDKKMTYFHKKCYMVRLFGVKPFVYHLSSSPLSLILLLVLLL